MILFYAVLSLLIFWMTGYSVLRLLHIGEERMKRNPLFPVLIGFCVFLSIVMTLGMFLPVNVVVIILAVGLTASFFFHIRRIYSFFVLETGTGEKAFLFAALIPMVIAGLPQILRNELYISILTNNDCGYYIASMDWLKHHTLLAPVEFSMTHPFYSMAEFMVEDTRIGTDVTGAFFMNLFHLEAYQVFPLIHRRAISLIMIAVYEVISFFSGNRLIAVVIAILAAVNGNHISQMGSQYVPQLIGISLLLLSLYELDRFFHKPDKEAVIAVGFALSGLLATYCEFGVYIVPFGLVYLFVFLIKRKLNLIALLKAAALTVILNVFGFCRAVSFLLSIYNRVRGLGITDIDPNGNLLEGSKLAGLLTGLSDGWIDETVCYTIGIVILVITAVCGILLIIRKKALRGRLMFFVWAVMFFCYELYFRSSGGGYPEYKHISSGCVFVFCIIGCILARIPLKTRIHQTAVAIILILLCWFVYSGLAKPMRRTLKTNFMMDRRIMELEEAAKWMVPADEEIEVDDSVQTIYYMGASYALKDRVLNMNTGGSSYLQFFNQFHDNDPSAYVVYSRGYEVSLPKDEEVLWMNDRYVLVKKRDIQPYKWFHITGTGFVSPARVFVSEAADYVQNNGEEGFVLFGPYFLMDGRYEIIMEYTVPADSQNSGNLQIAADGETLMDIPMESAPGPHTIRLSDQMFEDAHNTEFRVSAKKGYTVRIDGIKYRRLDVE